ncbi:MULTISPECIES: phage holin family protein [unclassified Citrobacter]|uniref:phage holin family protein n=1 Tax=unclassified Citrobacter TaxID=2644389 RepID=UPI00107AC82C|nr:MULTISPECIES: phage holin family protein [unclassified Citrobacter]MDA8500816.1 phage holin family protein [Citrobacter sp. Igbk 17]MDA8514747.1 phage holin family protein [Citrobacter sp. Igbk 14]MDA8516633.1 phage holin family protein [Citrobacter sp. Igbk 16]MEB2418931.1 phage holin family protein [Citrobacter sp. R-1.5.2]
MTMIIGSEPTVRGIIELETILAVIIVSAWGGVVSYLMRETRRRTQKNIKGCLKQVVISCFTGFLLSSIALDKGAGTHMILILSGLGGVFAGPVLKMLKDKLAQIFVK